MSFLRRGRFLRARLGALKPSTRHRFNGDETLLNRQMQARAELVSSGKNIDRAPLDYEKGLPIG